MVAQHVVCMNVCVCVYERVCVCESLSFAVAYHRRRQRIIVSRHGEKKHDKNINGSE